MNFQTVNADEEAKGRGNVVPNMARIFLRKHERLVFVQTIPPGGMLARVAVTENALGSQ